MMLSDESCVPPSVVNAKNSDSMLFLGSDASLTDKCMLKVCIKQKAKSEVERKNK